MIEVLLVALLAAGPLSAAVAIVRLMGRDTDPPSLPHPNTDLREVYRDVPAGTNRLARIRAEHPRGATGVWQTPIRAGSSLDASMFGGLSDLQTQRLDNRLDEIRDRQNPYQRLMALHRIGVLNLNQLREQAAELDPCCVTCGGIGYIAAAGECAACAGRGLAEVHP